MSASQEKKTRVGQRDGGAGKHNGAMTEEEKKSRAFRRNTIIVIVAVVVIVALSLIITSDLLYRNTTAVTVTTASGTTKYSPAELDVFYRNTFNSIYSSYGDFASYLIDTSTPLSEQSYTEDMTWADYIYEQTLTSMKQITAVYDDAVANGYTLSEELSADVDGQMETLSLYASMYGFSSADSYLAQVYGKGVNTQVFRSVLTRMETAQGYSESIRAGFTYDASALDTYYNENADDLDVFTYYAYTVYTSDAAFADMSEEEQKTAARAAAEEIALAADGEDFAARVNEFNGSEASETNTSGASLNSNYRDWMLSADRQAGDTTVADTDNGSIAVLFLERSDNSYLLRSMRHILINAEADDEGNYSDEALAAAESRIAEIETEWLETPTEDNFAALANLYSDDTGSNTSGGLYENIYRHQMVAPIDSFLFAEGRQSGETTKVYSGESAGYQGWHLVYYVGEGEQTYREFLADNALRSADYTAWEDGLTGVATVNAGGGLRYANLT